MYHKLWFFIVFATAVVTVAAAGRSANADFVEEFLRQKSPGFKAPGSRYSTDVIEDALLDVPGLVTKYGYPIEVHTVVTEDGYVLEAHRIPYGRDQNNEPDPDKPVVVLMHGMYSSSADYLVIGPGNALGYLLAESGFDVWLLNGRGTHYSRKHLYLDPRNLDYWNFSWEEVGMYDLPAFIDFILEHTGHSKIHYIGHSMGGTSFFVLTSMRPEYNEKFITQQSMAPAAFFIYNEDPTYEFLAPSERPIKALLNLFGINSIFTNREFFIWFAVNHCHEDATLHNFCRSLLSRDEDINNFNSTMLPVFLGHAPSGASFGQLTHYAQLINSHTFRRYSFSPIENIERYGQPVPPSYNLDNIVAPVHLHYSLADVQTNPRDVLYLSERLPNVAGVHLVERESFNHIDFVWGVDARAQVYENVVDIIKNAEEDNK